MHKDSPHLSGTQLAKIVVFISLIQTASSTARMMVICYRTNPITNSVTSPSMAFLTPPNLPIFQRPRKPPRIICGRRSKRKRGPTPVCTRPQTPLPPLLDNPERHKTLAGPPPNSESAVAIQKVLSRRCDCVVTTGQAYESGALATVLSKRERAEHTLVIVTTRDAALIAASEARYVSGKTQIIVAAGSRVPGGWRHPALNANSARKSVIVIASVRACFHHFLLNSHGRGFLKKIKYLILVDAVGIVDIGAHKLLNRVLKAMTPREKRKNVVFSRASSDERKLAVEKLVGDVVRVNREQLQWYSDELQERKEPISIKGVQDLRRRDGSMFFSAATNLEGNENAKYRLLDKKSLNAGIRDSADDNGGPENSEEAMFRILSMPSTVRESDDECKTFSASNVKDFDNKLTRLTAPEAVHRPNVKSSSTRDKRTIGNVVGSPSPHISEQVSEGLKDLAGGSNPMENNRPNPIVQNGATRDESNSWPAHGHEVDDCNSEDDTDILSVPSDEQLHDDSLFSETTQPLKIENETHSERHVREIVMIGNWAGAYEHLRVLLENNNKNEGGGRILVVFPTGRLAECYATMCRADGLPLQDIHRRTTPVKRERILEWIYNNDRGVLFATDTVTNNIVLPRLEIVVQFGAPHCIKGYVSRVQLVRDGGEALLMVGTREAGVVLKQLVDQKRSVERQELPVGNPWQQPELDMKARGRAYLSLISFWLLRRSTFGWVTRDVINFVNEWAQQAFGEVPEVENCKLKKMPIYKKEGLKVKIHPPPPPRVRTVKRAKKRIKSMTKEAN